MLSSRPGDSKYKIQSSSSAKDSVAVPSKGGKSSKGVTNDSLKKLGRGMAKAAANGKAY